MYPNESVSRFIQDNFLPVRLHAVRDKQAFKEWGDRYNAHWTPTTLIVDPSGTERHRIEGFLPVDDFLAQLRLGLGHSAFKRGDYREAERLFRELSDRKPETTATPEALYWAGVSRYKATGEHSALAQLGEEFSRRFTDTDWAKKASVWGPKVGAAQGKH